MWGSPLISDRILVLATAVIVGFAASTDALRSQARRYEIHRRGMLHQTVYNTGELGRPYDDGNTGSTPNIPSFEWPARSAMFVDGTPYNGQYNSFGAGFYIFATKNLDSANRYTDMCGAVSDNDGNAGVVEGECGDRFTNEVRQNIALTRESANEFRLRCSGPVETQFEVKADPVTLSCDAPNEVQHGTFKRVVERAVEQDEVGRPDAAVGLKLSDPERAVRRHINVVTPKGLAVNRDTAEGRELVSFGGSIQERDIAALRELTVVDLGRIIAVADRHAVSSMLR